MQKSNTSDTHYLHSGLLVLGVSFSLFSNACANASSAEPFTLGAITTSGHPTSGQPEPRYTVSLEKSHRLTMRDGVMLSTDLYIPNEVGGEAAGDLPTILYRTPYDKARVNSGFRGHRQPGSVARMFAGQGFVVAIQDKRGKFESEGEYHMAGGDVDDADDTINWIAQQPWSNGKVGMYGCSYLGAIQIKAAQTLNPHLAAIVPQALATASGSVDNRYMNFFWKGGAIEIMAASWFRDSGSRIYYRPPPGLSREQFQAIVDYFDPEPKPPEVKWMDAIQTLPFIDIDKVAAMPPTDWRDVVSHFPDDPWWKQFGYLANDSKVDVPALFINSWHDHGVAETLSQFNFFRRKALSKQARDNQFVIISPTTHCNSEEATTADTQVYDRDLGDSRFDFFGTYLRWFDYWLKGEQNHATQMPPVQYFVMGLGQWKSSSEWPLPETQFTKFYFHSDGHANSRMGSGSLSLESPAEEQPDTFVYDPATPVPSTPRLGGDSPDSSMDQRDLEMRSDVLVYSTPPLDQGIEVTGPLKAVLYVSSSAKDTDFTAKLVDVYPDGRAFLVQESILRARYRDGFDRRSWMKPGGVYQLEVDIEATSNYFAPGHRIRIEISSSNFPRFDRNLHTGGNNFEESEWVVATNTIHHSKKYPSHLLLPVIPQTP